MGEAEKKTTSYSVSLLNFYKNKLTKDIISRMVVKSIWKLKILINIKKIINF